MHELVGGIDSKVMQQSANHMVLALAKLGPQEGKQMFDDDE
tara:strand:+ start:2438 stop:2560 length:123 start_codon:yes stop_codon:yes gene_type:complete